MASVGELYAQGRERLTALLEDLPADQAEVRVPSCPAWMVRDVAAHLAGSCADILAGRLDGVATEAWTAAQVEARRGRPLADLLAEWQETAPQVEAMAEHFPGRSGQQWVFDLTTHEHDIRHALGRPGARDSEAVSLGLEFLVGVGLDAALRARGLGPLEITAGGSTWMVGGGEAPAGTGDVASAVDQILTARLMGADEGVEASGPPVASLEVSRFELFRALAGRRSRRQIAAFHWSVDPEPYLDAFTFGPFTPSHIEE